MSLKNLIVRQSAFQLIVLTIGLITVLALPPYIPGSGLTDEICGQTGENASYLYDQQLERCSPSFKQIKNPNKCQEKAASPYLECDWNSRYRTVDGTCNNPCHPFDGAVGECLLRYMPASYEGRDGFRLSKSGGPLPVPRNLTLNIFTNRFRRSEKNVSMMFTGFGQYVAHDTSLILQEDVNMTCCTDFYGFHPACIPLLFPEDDPYYAQFNITCLPFPRSVPCASCGTGKREILNNQTAAIDASVTYGPYVGIAKELRAFDGYGRLKTDNTSVGQLLQRGKSANDLFCINGLAHEEDCFKSGDPRVNQHDILMSLQTVFMREHNRIAVSLKTINPEWMEETLYQEARRIVIAELQSITYNKFLPLLLGPTYMDLQNLTVQTGPRGTTYNPRLQLQTRAEFSGALFRLHTLVASRIGVPHLRFRDIYISPQYIRDGMLSQFLSGSCKAASQRVSRHMPRDTTDLLYLPIFEVYGQDLSSIDIQRGRELGIRPYVDFIKYCSGSDKQIDSFDQLRGLISKKNRALLKENYKQVEDIDAWVGVQLEKHASGSLVGPTTACILAEQFHNFKYADRFYWEHEDVISSFTPVQRMALLNSSIARLLCDNVPEIKNISMNAMILPSEQNPVVSCDDIPEVDLGLWKTYNSQQITTVSTEEL